MPGQPYNLAGGFEDLYFRNTELDGLAFIVNPVPADFRSCELLFEGREGTFFTTSNRRDYVKIYRVMVTNKNLGPYAVCKCPGLPFPYAPYLSADGLEVDTNAFAVNIAARQEHQDDWQAWLVTVNYSSDMPDEGPDFFTDWPDFLGPQTQPWLRRPGVKIDSEEVMVAEPCDLDGKPYLSAARQPLTPSPVFPEVQVVYTITRNMRDLTPEIIVKYTNAVNSVIFLGQPPGTVKCDKPSGELLYHGKVAYWKTVWRARIKTRTIPDFDNPDIEVRETWQPTFLNQGTYELQLNPFVPLYGEPVPIMKHGQPVTQPQLLDTNGRRLQPNEAGVLVPNWLRFRRFPEQDLNEIFSNLIIP